MKAPETLEILMDYGIIQEVVRPLMSGKEAQVYVVVSGGEERVAKVYKEATQRTFKHRSDYTEGRRTRNSRDQRAMSKRTQHGRKIDEDAWRSTEVDMIYRLRDAGVRVPEPFHFAEGVLVMELVKDADGHAAPRLGDLSFSPSEASAIYQTLIREVVRMLCAGVIHGDLSDFNVLMSHNGPVVIDFPQAVDPTQNANGKTLLLRDVANLHRFLSRYAPDEPVRPYGEEIWKLFQSNLLKPDTQLSGLYQAPVGQANTEEVMALIEDAKRDDQRRRGVWQVDAEDEFEALDSIREGTRVRTVVKPPAPLRKVVDFSRPLIARTSPRKHEAGGRKASPTRPNRSASEKPEAPSRAAIDSVATTDGFGATRRRRRRGRVRAQGSPQSTPDAASTATSAERRAPANASVRSTSRRPTNAASTTPRVARTSGEKQGEKSNSDRPPRRRRRRPRKPPTQS